MHKIRLQAVIVGIFISIMVTSTSVYATNTSSRLEEAKDKKASAESGIDRAKDEIDDLNGERSSLQTYVDQLNTQMQNASFELAEIEALIDSKEQEMKENKVALEQAKKDQKEQYVSMKARIKFMYECRDSAYLDLFFSAGSFSEFLNKNDYVEKLTQYDRDMLKKYVDLQESIKRNEGDLVDSQTALEELQAQAMAKSEEVMEIIQTASKELTKYQDQIKEQEKRMLAYEQEIERQNNNITLLEQELKTQQALTDQSVMRDLSGIKVSASDIDMLAAIIQCEAGGEPYVGKVAVGAVVLNRVKSSSFPNTVLEVIYQNRQFSPVASGRFAVVLAQGANESCYQAAREALAGTSPVGDKLFFRTPIPGLVGQRIGGHIFH